jgi:hypothetical protein
MVVNQQAADAANRRKSPENQNPKAPPAHLLQRPDLLRIRTTCEPCVVCPSEPFEEAERSLDNPVLNLRHTAPQRFAGAGMAWAMTRDALAQATATVSHFIALYDDLEASLDRRIRAAFDPIMQRASAPR